MGAKKKVEVQQAPPPPQPEKPTNVILKVTTSDHKQFKISQDLLTRFSPKAKSLAESSKDNSIKFDDIDSQSFEYIVKYIELHKDKDPAKIVVPIRSNQSVAHIMQEGDAELLEKILQIGDELLLKMMDATLALQLQSFRRRLACAVAIKLMHFTVQQLKQEYELNQHNFEDEVLRNQTRPLIDQLKKTFMEQQN